MTEAGAHLDQAKVLIADLESRSIQPLAQAFRDSGYAVFEANSFVAAKLLWERELPQILVADVRLGQFNGLQLLMRALEEQPGLTAVITCAFADPVLEAETSRLGATFMVKPLEPGQVLAAVIGD